MCPSGDCIEVEERILDATMRVLAREGYDGATTRKIAEEAGINEVTLFRRFKNKENLVKAASERNLNRFLKKLDMLFDERSDDDLLTYMDRISQSLSAKIEDKINLIIVSIGELQRLPECERTLPKYSLAILQHLTDYFQKQKENGNLRDVDPQVAALSFYSFIFYMSFISQVHGKQPVTDRGEALKQFIDIFMNGVSKPGIGALQKNNDKNGE